MVHYWGLSFTHQTRRGEEARMPIWITIPLLLTSSHGLVSELKVQNTPPDMALLETAVGTVLTLNQH